MVNLSRSNEIISDAICSFKQLGRPSYVWKDVVLNDRIIPILVNGADFIQSLELYGCYEPSLTHRFIEIIKEAGSLFDIGSSFGYYSILASHLMNTLEIHAFDYSRSAFWALRKSVRRGKAPMPYLHRVLVGDSNAPGKMITIDRFVESTRVKEPILIKMDIEGHEVGALSGMSYTIKKHHPSMLIEIHPDKITEKYDHGISRLVSILKSSGYLVEICRNHRGHHRGPVTDWEPCNMSDLEAYCKSLVTTGANFALLAR